MKAWTEDPEPHETGRTPEAPSSADADDASSHAHGDLVHSHAHGHPHPSEAAGLESRPAVGIVGAGPVGTALGVAMARAGWPVVAVASRDPERRSAFRSLVPDAKGFDEAAAILDEAALIFLTVPDDAVSLVAADLRLYGGQALVHTSGVMGVEALDGANAAGAQLGSFHPLVAFTGDVERSVAALHGATIALEGQPQLLSLLADIAEAIGGVPVRLAPGGRAAYHAAAVLAAGGFVALLDAIGELGRAAGLDEAGALAVYGRLIEQTLSNARSEGIAASLTGPIVRGDLGTIQAHLAALRTYAPGALELYLAAARREVTLAEERGVLAPDRARTLRASLAKPA